MTFQTNQLKTAALMAVLTGLLSAGGYALAGPGGLIVAVLLALLVNAGAYWFSDRIVIKMHRAQEIRETDAPGLYSMGRELARRAGVPTPKLYLLNEDAPNAFATGRDPNHGAIAITRGLMRLLTKDELAAVIAHEMSHIQRRDTLITTVAATLAGAIGFLAHFSLWNGHAGENDRGRGIGSILLWLVMAPLAATLIQMAISRAREFLADESGARLAGNPLALADALEKIDAASSRKQLSSASPVTAHLFIRNPISGAGLGRLFQTHPPTSERVERLEMMALRRVA